jgi:hypothetical protein
LKDLDSEKEPNEKEYSNLLGKAIRILDFTTTVSPDPALEREILLILKDKFFRSRSFRILIALTALLALFSFGGTVLYGTKVKGFLKTTEDATKKIKEIEEGATKVVEGMVGGAYLDTKKKIEERVTTIVSNIETAALEDIEVIQNEKEIAISEIQAAKGKVNKKERTGALGVIQNEKDIAISEIQAAKGKVNKKERTGTLGVIQNEKEIAIRMINQTIGNKDIPDSALGEIEDEKERALQKIDDALSEPELELKINQLNMVYDNAVDFIPVANKIQKAHEILKDGLEGVKPRYVFSLLNISTVVLIVMFILSLFALGLAGAAFLKSRKILEELKGSNLNIQQDK